MDVTEVYEAVEIMRDLFARDLLELRLRSDFQIATTSPVSEDLSSPCFLCEATWEQVGAATSLNPPRFNLKHGDECPWTRLNILAGKYADG